MTKVSYGLVVGRLMDAMVCTLSDIGYSVGVISQFLSNSGREHWATVKWILRYLKGTSNVRLQFGSGKPLLEWPKGQADVDTSC